MWVVLILIKEIVTIVLEVLEKKNLCNNLELKKFMTMQRGKNMTNRLTKLEIFKLVFKELQ